MHGLPATTDVRAGRIWRSGRVGASLISAALLGLVGLAGCDLLEQDREFAVALRSAPTDQHCRLILRGGHVIGYAAPLPADAIPAAARRMADEFVMPGGRTVFVGKEWSADSVGYRFVKEYPREGGEPARRRSLLVRGDGSVLQRSHEIDAGQGPPPALAAARHSESGTAVRVEVLQGQPGTDDRYRYEFRDADGRCSFVICSAAGEVLERGRCITADVSHLRPR